MDGAARIGPLLLLDTCVHLDILEDRLPSAAETLIQARPVAAPSIGVSLEAGILCGLVFRLGDFQKGQEVTALNDATIFLHALDHGYAALTRNRNDFDRMNQVVPAGQVLFYDPA